ncbi:MULTISPECIES: EAL domain-containing protein [Enterobacter]|uniref:EAL domain-containing protein n=1 Tax=Enterobacter TaxID=547 RepID=UPI0015EACA70|nr:MULTISPECIES: EAL domain-containing protein [Enterobacter]HDR2753868.1 EAL domain-containing protein [Enterobacter asburiae]QMR77005.1 EAL domain-containing protein [Enterobacter sp. RHBSTW-00175]WNT37541.1 EAL domain-containing protein [Enterobacter cloacae]HDR2788788.1 EAL domain-containing protein [Enterobacter asburiae]HDR2794492.1 EAL domain-containing protein [Enterobacter asburiae]
MAKTGRQQEDGVAVQFPRLQHISRNITGIKLEPIVALSTSHTVGAEVLSVLSPHQQSERFFQRQSAVQSLMLLEAQLCTLKNALNCNNLFINLPITVLTVGKAFHQLMQLKSSPLNIEIVEPASFFSLSSGQRESVTHRLQLLSRQGHRIWLDDVDETVIQPFLSCRLPLCGIKIDKVAFWRLRATPALSRLVSLCSQIAGHVLIEGIENDQDRAYALQAGAGLGQGYHWPCWYWPED